MERLEARWLLSAPGTVPPAIGIAAAQVGSVTAGLVTVDPTLVSSPSDLTTTTQPADSTAPDPVMPVAVAQSPDFDTLVFSNTMSAGTYVQSYSLQIKPGTDSVELEVRSPDAKPGVTAQVAIFDTKGHPLAASPLVDTGPPVAIRWTPTVGPDGEGQDFPVVVKVSLYPPKDTTSTTYAGDLTPAPSGQTDENYTLIVRRHWHERSAEPPPGEPPPHVASPPPPRISQPSPVPSIPPPQILLTAAVTDKPSSRPNTEPDPAPQLALAVVATPVASGPLPSRAVAPLGGVFATGDSAPVPDPRDPSVIDLALIDLPVGEVGEDKPIVDNSLRPVSGPTTWETHGEATSSVVVVRGPGGFPLFGSSLHTETRQRRSNPLPELPTAIIAALPPNPTAEESGPSKRSFETDPLRPRTVRRASILAGLSVALALTLGPSLPDLNDVFVANRTRRFRLARFLGLWGHGRPDRTT